MLLGRRCRQTLSFRRARRTASAFPPSSPLPTGGAMTLGTSWPCFFRCPAAFLSHASRCRPAQSRTCLLECVFELLALYKVHSLGPLFHARAAVLIGSCLVVQERQNALVKSIVDERLQFEVSTIEDIPVALSPSAPRW